MVDIYFLFSTNCLSYLVHLCRHRTMGILLTPTFNCKSLVSVPPLVRNFAVLIFARKLQCLECSFPRSKSTFSARGRPSSSLNRSMAAQSPSNHPLCVNGKRKTLPPRGCFDRSTRDEAGSDRTRRSWQRALNWMTRDATRDSERKREHPFNDPLMGSEQRTRS